MWDGWDVAFSAVVIFWPLVFIWLLNKEILGSLRQCSVTDWLPVSELRYPDDEFNWRNWPALPAVEAVQGYVGKYESLEWIVFCPDTAGRMIEEGDPRVSLFNPFL